MRRTRMIRIKVIIRIIKEVIDKEVVGQEVRSNELRLLRPLLRIAYKTI